MIDVDLAGLARLLGGYVDDFGDLREFFCAACQPRGWTSMYGPAATVVDDLRWRCALCKATRTIWTLRRLILEDVDLLDRILEAHEAVTQ